MSAAPLAIGVVAAAATMAGGALALRFHARLAALVGFSGGAVIGVALLDLLPEAMALGTPAHDVHTLMLAAAAGLFAYLMLDRLLSRSFGASGHLGPASLTVHSLMDGLGIGLAFKVSPAAGVIVAIAVLAHDLLDGANTVALAVAGGREQAARRWLLADAAAPLAGILLARLASVPADTLALLLAFFAGGFLYIGASELLPRSRLAPDGIAQAASVGLGVGLIYLVVLAAG